MIPRSKTKVNQTVEECIKTAEFYLKQKRKWTLGIRPWEFDAHDVRGGISETGLVLGEWYDRDLEKFFEVFRERGFEYIWNNDRIDIEGHLLIAKDEPGNLHTCEVFFMFLPNPREKYDTLIYATACEHMAGVIIPIFSSLEKRQM